MRKSVLQEPLTTQGVTHERNLRRRQTRRGSAHAERAQATLQELRTRLTALEEQVRARARDVDSYVRDNPWQAVAVAGGIALLFGLLMGRR
jgi:ElaB/YqjD/DUF883 family membrane-anchored ribosome-binding protein